MKVRMLILTTLFSASLLPAFAQNAPITNQDAVTPAVAPGPSEAIIQTTSVSTSPSWKWTVQDKWDLADLKSESGKAEINAGFLKHELENFHVNIAANSIAVKFTGDKQKQREKNKLPVTLSYGNGPSVSETWGVVQYNDGMVLAPRNNEDKDFLRAMKSKTFTISYTDVTGAVVTEVFNIGDMGEQMKSHHVKVHTFGFGDAFAVAAATAGAL